MQINKLWVWILKNRKIKTANNCKFDYISMKFYESSNCLFSFFEYNLKNLILGGRLI